MPSSDSVERTEIHTSYPIESMIDAVEIMPFAFILNIEAIPRFWPMRKSSSASANVLTAYLCSRVVKLYLEWKCLLRVPLREPCFLILASLSGGK
jgi:hypothetical protein